MYRVFFVLCLAASLASTSALAQLGPSTGAFPTETATYRVTFQALWSEDTHPDDFPQSAHFSSLIGGSHGDNASFWSPGGTASPGIQAVAEFGSTSSLATEVDAAIAAGNALAVVRGGNVSTSPGTATAEVELSRTFHRITLVTMIAPSPDWFVGTHGLSLFQNGDWALRLEVPLFAYDSGTDSGPTFRSPNEVTQPSEAIQLIDTFPLEDHAPIGSFVFERLDVPQAPVLSLGGGRFTVTAEWETTDGTRGFGQPEQLTPDTGTFWFFDPANLELVVKVLDACSFAGSHWVFAGGLTDVSVVLTVRDSVSGLVRSYRNAPSTPFQPIQDTRAFPSCP